MSGALDVHMRWEGQGWRPHRGSTPLRSVEETDAQMRARKDAGRRTGKFWGTVDTGCAMMQVLGVGL